MQDNVKISLDLVALSRIHIGSGIISETPTIDKPIVRKIRDGRVKYYIPATSLKGVLRSCAITMANGRYENICTSVKPGEVGKCVNKGEECIVCRIFGRPGKQGKIFVSDAETNTSKVGISVGILIDRKYQTVSKGKLFFYETLPPRTMFSTTIIAKNLTEEEFSLLLESLVELEFRGIGGKSGFVRPILKDIKGVYPRTSRIDKLLDYLRREERG